jgi:uncharacterized membrane protein
VEKIYLYLSKVGYTTALFVVIALFFGLIIVKEVPLFWGLDESAHFGRSYQISQGHFAPKKLHNGNYGGVLPASVVGLDAAAHQDLLTPSLAPVIGRHDDKHAALQKMMASQKIDRSRKENFNFPGSASYSPLAYVAPSAGILVCRVIDCSVGQTVLLARGFSLISYVGIVAFSLCLLRKQRLKWLVFVIALLPMAVFQASAVSADGPVISLSLLLFALTLKVLVEKKLSWPLLALLGLVALWLPLAKATYGLLDLCLLPVALVLWEDRRKALRYASVSLAVIVLVTLGWLHAARGATKAISLLQASSPNGGTIISIRKQAQLMLHKPQVFEQAFVNTVVIDEPYWVYSTVGEFGLNTVQLPLGAIVLADTIIVASAFYASNEAVRHKASSIFMGTVSVATAFGILLTLYLTFTYAGKANIDGVQGRYFIPLLPFFFIGIVSLIPARLVMSSKTAAILFSAGSSLVLLSGVVYYGLAVY